MPTVSENNVFIMRCACYSAPHTAMLIHEPDDTRGNNLKGEHDDWYLSVLLDNFHFWKRVRTAFRYIFAPRTIPYGMTAELVLRTEDVTRLANFITRRTRS